MACVYFIRGCDTDYCKIGMTRRGVHDRVSGMALPFDYSVVGVLNCASIHDAFVLENYLHRFFANSRARGEWFVFGRGHFAIVEWMCGVLSGQFVSVGAVASFIDQENEFGL